MGDIRKYNYGVDLASHYDYKNKQKNLQHHVEYMLNRSNIMFEYKNLPDTIPARELEVLLQTNGFCAFVKIDGDFYVVNGGLGGLPDVYNRPTQIVVTVPYLNYNATLDIDKDCVIIPNDSMYIGLLPLYEKYCTIMMENEITMILATVNKRVQNLLSANDDNTVESAKQFLKNVFDGELGVIAESQLFDSLKVNNSSANSQVSMKDLFEFQQYTKASLFNEIGLSANYNMKRERLTANEVEANTDNLYPLVDDMLKCRRLALEKINEMFGLNIEVQFNSSWDYRLFNGEPIDSEVIADDATFDNSGDDNNSDVNTGVSDINDNTQHSETTDGDNEADRRDIEDTETVNETTEETIDETTEETTDETTEETEESTDEKPDTESDEQSENDEASEEENETDTDTDDEEEERK